MQNNFDSPQPHSGFTLASLAALLVLIGLLSGAILFGQDLLHAAYTRFAIAQVEQFNNAVLSFKQKYNCLPGDCAKTQDGAAGGNEDGTIGCSVETMSSCITEKTAAFSEYINFWHQLSAAHFIDGTYAPYQRADKQQAAGIVSPPVDIRPVIPVANRGNGWAMRGAIYISDNKDIAKLEKHHFEMGYAATLPENSRAIYSASDIYKLDDKIDDGFPFTGSVRAWSILNSSRTSVYIPTVGSGGKDVAVCVNNDPNPAEYNTAYRGEDEAGLCAPLIKAGF